MSEAPEGAWRVEENQQESPQKNAISSDAMRWLIVGGCPRSGTSILHKLLRTHPEIALLNESSLLRWIRSEGEDAAAAALLSRVPTEKRTRVRYIGEKLPEYYEPSFSRLFRFAPPLRIHITRRPAAVVSSMLRRSAAAKSGKDRRWSPHFGVRDGIDAWVRAWHYAMRKQHQKDFLHIKYEDLVFQPNEQLQRIAIWLDVNDDFRFKNKLVMPPLTPLDARDAELFERELGPIDSAWAKTTLGRLQKEYSHLRPSPLSGVRRLRRVAMWWLHTRRHSSGPFG